MGAFFDTCDCFAQQAAPACPVWRKIGESKRSGGPIRNKQLISLALPRGLRRPSEFNHLAKSGTPNRSTQSLGFLPPLSHLGHAVELLTSEHVAQACPPRRQFHEMARSFPLDRSRPMRHSQQALERPQPYVMLGNPAVNPRPRPQVEAARRAAQSLRAQ